jgi:transposase InsO family protein
VSDKYAVIAAHRREFAITLMCRVLEVSPSGFHAAQRRPPSARARKDVVLLGKVRAAHTKSRQRYGSPRVTEQLHRTGERVSAKRVARVMRAAGLVARRPRAFVVTTNSAHTDPVAPNLVARDFAVGPVRACNTVWASDITYIPTRAGWLYLAVVIDLASRRVIGWATSASLDTALPLTALQRALAVREPPRGLVHHSDRGCQYASAEYRACLAAHGGILSMSRRGDCWDNAVVESFFATLEWELLMDEDFATHPAANRALVEFINVWYNHERLHSTLGYKTPVEYEQDLRRASRAA